jgi:hypothetical protein
MYAIWNNAGIATHASRGTHILGHLAQTGLICFGPRDGKQQTFTLVEEWLPGARLRERDAALGEVARRYFTSHGPATIHDFVWWSGLKIADARAGLDAVKSTLESEIIDGRTFWFLPSVPVPRLTNTVYLLPSWDEYTVAYRDRSDILDPKYALQVNAGGGVLKPVIVSRGRVVGSWQRTFVKNGMVVRPSMFVRVDASVREAIDVAARKYGRFLGVDAARAAD